MGSSCSILNDTENDVYITHGVNYGVLIGAVTGTLAVVTAGAGAMAIAAGTATAAAAGTAAAAAAAGALVITADGVVMGAIAGGTALGLTAGSWTVMSIVTATTSSILGASLGISSESADKLKTTVKKFTEEATLVKPGKCYKWSGTLSLTMRVYTMNKKLETDDRACFTGWYAGSTNEYTISEHFSNLSVDKDIHIVP